MNRKYLIGTIAIIFLLTSLAFLPGEIKTLEIGEAAPMKDQKMMDVSGKELSLSQIMGKKGLLVIFSCNTCPFVIGKNGSDGWEGRYESVGKHALEMGIGAILINSNEARRTDGDSFEEMIERAKKFGYNMKYALDKNHAVADAFGARTTPHVFLFGTDFKLAYKGAIDDNCNSKDKVSAHWLKDAMTKLSLGENIDPKETRNMGCSIKRVNKG